MNLDPNKIDSPEENKQNNGLDPEKIDALIASDEASVAEPEITFGEFRDAGLDEGLLEAIQKLNWTKPTAVQSMCLPYTVAGKDLAGFAQTGTGKTGVFLISIAHKVLTMRANKDQAVKKPIAIVLSPTRELAMQIESDAQGLFSTLGIKSLAVFGGVDYEKQARVLNDGVDVVVATPGRLKDFAQKKVVNINNCQIFVCDEADRMFDMGFIDDVKFFFNLLDEKCQRLLFSATTSANVGELAFEYLNNPKYISATPESITPEAIEQKAIICEAQHKLQVMIGLLRDQSPSCSIVFTNTKLTAEWLHFKLNGNGFETDIITGDLPQRKRINLIERIKEGKVKALIATDVASRGLHIAGVTHVYNFDLPDDASNYVHRIGRTARAGAKGYAVSFVCEDYGDNLKAINDLLGPLAMRAEWYDSEYEKIKDMAGNPFPKNSGRSSGQRSSGQGPRQQGQGNNRNGGGRRDSRPAQGSRDQRPRSNDNRPRRDGPQNQQNQNQQSQRGPRRDNRDHNRDRGDNRHQNARPNQNQHHQQQQRRFDRNAQPTVSAKKVETPKTFTGLVKKIFSTLFGSNKD